jgi:hypothetical protein
VSPEQSLPSRLRGAGGELPGNSRAPTLTLLTPPAVERVPVVWMSRRGGQSRQVPPRGAGAFAHPTCDPVDRNQLRLLLCKLRAGKTMRTTSAEPSVSAIPALSPSPPAPPSALRASRQRCRLRPPLDRGWSGPETGVNDRKGRNAPTETRGVPGHSSGVQSASAEGQTSPRFLPQNSSWRNPDRTHKVAWGP